MREEATWSAVLQEYIIHQMNPRVCLMIVEINMWPQEESTPCSLSKYGEPSGLLCLFRLQVIIRLCPVLCHLNVYPTQMHLLGGCVLRCHLRHLLSRRVLGTKGTERRSMAGGFGGEAARLSGWKHSTAGHGLCVALHSGFLFPHLTCEG